MPSNKLCCYCNESFTAENLRPYGPDGAYTCYPCASSTAHAETTSFVRAAALQACIASVKATGCSFAAVEEGLDGFQVVPKTRVLELVPQVVVPETRVLELVPQVVVPETSSLAGLLSKRL